MIRIDINAQHVEGAADLWYDGLQKKAGTYWGKMDTKIEAEYNLGKLKNEKRQYRLCKLVLNHYKKHFKDYVLAKEDFLKRNSSVIRALAYKYPLAKEILKDMFVSVYNDFCKQQTAYEVMKKLRVNVCPYCNRQFTFTVDNSKKTRPEFDHFYDKASYPLLALSFYNLVPSCHTCNHLKRNDEAAINPYFHGFEHKFRVMSKDAHFKGDVMTLKTSELELKLNNANAEELKNMKTFGLNALYNLHIDYVESVLDRVKSYNLSAQQSLVDSFQGAGNSPQDVSDFVWRPYLEVVQNNWPLAKLTEDLLHQFGIIKK